MRIEIGKLDKEGVPPDSLAICLEFSIAWSNCTSETSGRLCAGALGIYLDKYAILPKYKPLKESPSTYGYKCLERLLEKNILPGQIFSVGTNLLADMAKRVPKEEEVQEEADFFPQAEKVD